MTASKNFANEMTSTKFNLNMGKWWQDSKDKLHTTRWNPLLELLALKALITADSVQGDKNKTVKPNEVNGDGKL